LRRPNPRFIIKFRRWRLGFKTPIPAAKLRKKINVTIEQSYLDMFDFSYEPVADDFTRPAIGRLRAPPGASLKNDFVLLNRANDGLLFGNGFRQWFFPVNILLLPRGFCVCERMPVTRSFERERASCNRPFRSFSGQISRGLSTPLEQESYQLR